MADTAMKSATATPQPSVAQVNGTAGTTGKTIEDRAATQKHYEVAKKELRDLLVRKKQADKDLAQLEAQIYKLEGSYLEDTQQGGNIVRGFDGYLKGLINSRKAQFSESDRLFSLSSVSYSETAQGADKSGNDSTTGNASTTGNKNKKRRKTIEVEGSDSDTSVQQSSNNKRARVTYAD